MAQIDFTAAYRDATQGSTLKALALRRAEQQAANQELKPRVVASPWQGAANIADTISGSIREGRLANQEAAGRARFAQLLAGGLAPDEIGEAMNLDPETTMKYQERTWAQEDTKATRDYESGRDTLKHGWDVDAATARVEAERKAREEGYTHEDTATEKANKVAADAAAREHDLKVEDDKRAAATADDHTLLAAALKGDNEVSVDEAVKRGLMPAADGDRLKQQIQQTAAADLASKAPDQWDAVAPEDIAKYGPDSDVAKNPGLYHINRKTGDVERIDQNAFGSMSPAAKEFDIQSSKDNQDWVATGRAQAASNQIQLDKVLADLDKYDKSTASPLGGGGSVAGAVSGATGIGAPSGVVTSVLPDAANRLLAGGVGAPDPVTMRENVRMVAQQSLKAVLGTQFAASEGEGVMNRAYDPGATPAENGRRVRLLKTKLEQVAKYNDLRADWLAQRGTMQGFTGPSPAEIQADFLAYTNSEEFTGGGGSGTAAAPAAEPDVTTMSEDDLKKIAGGGPR